MKSPDRLSRTITCLLGSLVASVAMAQADFPVKTIQFMVPQAAGGSTDTLARTIGQKLSDAMGLPVVSENRAGANGIIGTEWVAKAAPNGATLLVGGTGTMAINPSLYAKITYDPVKQFAAVANFGYSTSVLVVHPSLAPKTIGELIALAKSRPGDLKYASAGVGSSPHLSGELFKSMTGLTLPVVHYQGGGPALKAMIAGEAEVMFEPMSASIEPVRTGKLRALAVSTSTRSAALPDLPVVADAVPGYEASAVTGLGAPRGTPPDVIAGLNAAMNAAFTDDAMKRKLADTGGEPLPGTPADFAALMKAETEKWGKVVKSAQGK